MISLSHTYQSIYYNYVKFNKKRYWNAYSLSENNMKNYKLL